MTDRTWRVSGLAGRLPAACAKAHELGRAACERSAGIGLAYYGVSGGVSRATLVFGLLVLAITLVAGSSARCERHAGVPGGRPPERARDVDLARQPAGALHRQVGPLGRQDRGEARRSVPEDAGATRLHGLGARALDERDPTLLAGPGRGRPRLPASDQGVGRGSAGASSPPRPGPSATSAPTPSFPRA